jgi:nicotinate-nucleotide--dimethylbenzimidazole phosphoribosyltransferase
MTPHAFDPERRQGVYDAIAGRRDVRSFRPEPLPEDVLQRLLEAAHRAPSVGLMQPWDFIVVRDAAVRRRVQDLFAREKAAAAAFFDDPRRDQYLQLKLEGILQSALNLVVTCDPTRGGPEVLGRHSIPETDVYSTCLAVENLWLAARAEGVGVGWVSILRNPGLREILDIPPHIVPVAYLCVGYTDEFPDAPLLESVGWGSREALAGLVHYDAWGRKARPATSQTAAGGSDLSRLLRAIAHVAPLDATAADAARARQAQLTKPPGSLGRLERLATQIAGITARPRPRLEQRAVIVMAADHGVAAAEAVSAYPPQVTPQMVHNFARGGAAINVLARGANARVVVVDVGVAADLPADLPIVHRKVAPGTANLATGAAMTRDQVLAAIRVGLDVVEQECGRGLDVVCLGEMGIGNTTAASAIVAAITRLRVADVTGRGTGVDDTTWRRKVAVIERALRINCPDPDDALDVLAKVGGLEIAGLVGVTLGAAAHRLPIVIDGFIATTAALLAAELCPTTRSYLIAAHRSAEPGHRAALERLEIEPLLVLDLRLGEGTGAALALPIVDAALALLDEMATFDEAGISGATSAALVQHG